MQAGFTKKKIQEVNLDIKAEFSNNFLEFRQKARILSKILKFEEKARFSRIVLELRQKYGF